MRDIRSLYLSHPISPTQWENAYTNQEQGAVGSKGLCALLKGNSAMDMDIAKRCLATCPAHVFPTGCGSKGPPFIYKSEAEASRPQLPKLCYSVIVLYYIVISPYFFQCCHAVRNALKVWWINTRTNWCLVNFPATAFRPHLKVFLVCGRGCGLTVSMHCQGAKNFKKQRRQRSWERLHLSPSFQSGESGYHVIKIWRSIRFCYWQNLCLRKKEAWERAAWSMAHQRMQPFTLSWLISLDCKSRSQQEHVWNTIMMILLPFHMSRWSALIKIKAS